MDEEYLNWIFDFTDPDYNDLDLEEDPSEETSDAELP
jgi:hypothetical protein